MPSKPQPKPTLVLVHGFRGSPIGLKEISSHLESAGYQVLLPPVPPFGGAKKLSVYSPETYAEYLVNYIHEHHIECPVLAGHSMGSVVVAATVAEYPDLFNQKVILMSPISRRPALPVRLVSPLSGLLPASAVDYVTTKFLFVPKDKDLFRRTMSITHDCAIDCPPSKREVFAAARFSTKYATGDFHKNDLGRDILILAGESDHLVKKSDTEDLAKKLNAKAVFLKNTGHLHNYEQPKATADAIIDFLEQ